MSSTLHDLLEVMEAIAPSWAAEEWDKVGVVVGEREWKITRVWVGLELTPELVSEAAGSGEAAIVVHHNPLFNSLESITPSRPATAMLLEAARARVGVVAAHTNLDSAPGGVNDELARAVGLKQVEVLKPLEKGLARVVVFVPPEALEQVATAAFKAGAGVVGNYEGCGFFTRGTGIFTPRAGAKPWQGQAGRPEQVEELRFETLVPLARATQVLGAIKSAHPYEEPVVDIHPLGQGPGGFGMGRVGVVSPPKPPEQWLDEAMEALGVQVAMTSGPRPRVVERVAVVGGAGGAMVKEAARAGADALVTGEARYHEAEIANEAGVWLVCLGHYETEAVVLRPLAERIKKALGVDVGVWQRGGPWQAVVKG